MAGRERYNKRRDIRHSVPSKPDLGISDLIQDETNETIPPIGTVPPKSYDYTRGTSDQQNATDYTAPVTMPDRNDLAISLVSSDLIYKLEEYHSDENRVSAFFWTLIGAILGLLISWGTNTSTTITRFSIIILVLLSIITLVVGLYWRSLLLRIKEKKRALKK